MQRTKLAGHAITWHDRLDGVPAGPVFLIANEMFDALPARQFVLTGTGWAERLVTIEGDNFAFTTGDAPAALAERLDDLDGTGPGQIAELSPQREALARSIGERIRRDGGMALIIDYGAWVDHATGDTLQAVRDHRPADPLDSPGEADLTTQVDFKAPRPGGGRRRCRCLRSGAAGHFSSAPSASRSGRPRFCSAPIQNSSGPFARLCSG